MTFKIKKNSFLKVSQIEPEVLMRHIIYEVGEKAQDKLYNHLKDLAESYPKFNEWFYKIVYPEVELRNGEREIIIVLSDLEDHNIAIPILTGIAILKKKPFEKKICTFRIHEKYRNQGIGAKLFEECFEFLGTRKPIITISYDRKEMFETHISRYDFKEEEKLENYYVKGSIEYVYNGFLTKS